MQCTIWWQQAQTAHSGHSESRNAMSLAMLQAFITVRGILIPARLQIKIVAHLIKCLGKVYSDERLSIPFGHIWPAAPVPKKKKIEGVLKRLLHMVTKPPPPPQIWGEGQLIQVFLFRKQRAKLAASHSLCLFGPLRLFCVCTSGKAEACIIWSL